MHPQGVTPTEAELQVLRNALLGVQGPMNMIRTLTYALMQTDKMRDELPRDVWIARGIWHAFHYVERRLTGWDEHPDNARADHVAWEHKAGQWLEDAPPPASTTEEFAVQFREPGRYGKDVSVVPCGDNYQFALDAARAVRGRLLVRRVTEWEEEA